MARAAVVDDFGIPVVGHERGHVLPDKGAAGAFFTNGDGRSLVGSAARGSDSAGGRFNKADPPTDHLAVKPATASLRSGRSPTDPL